MAESSRFSQGAVDALQEACEDYLVTIFEDAQVAAANDNRVEIKPKDIKLVRRLRQETSFNS